MDDNVYKNWIKVKKMMEDQNKTDNPFYIRACIIAKTGKDPNEKGRD